MIRLGHAAKSHTLVRQRRTLDSLDLDSLDGWGQRGETSVE